ncbi:DUF465 domain-containing protein [Temperatibacter marinus]|uniref:DUF465 domain-containing protein n=1 Tax=Temperatibacter marinus TaxID=1456591 RepID=A0AA52ECV0_9PROT|nr:DUF465 domain-containing protein [Temperatibacter marinus]WND03092.1 DUF465 domain-containing protein [Temperatibacter marinus]
MDQEDLRHKLLSLVEEHHDLHTAIEAFSEDANGFDQLKIQRLKKRKLGLKDQISRLKAMMVPDIIA